MPRKSLSERLQRGVLPLAAAATTSLVFVDPAFANWITPRSGGSPNADAIHDLYMILLVLGLIVFAVVEGLLLYALWKFKASRGHKAKQTHGNTKLELALTAGASAIVIVLAIVSVLKLDEIRKPPVSDAAGFPGIVIPEDPDSNQELPPDGKGLHVKVTGFQYGWRYTYDDGDPTTKDPYTYHDLYAPTGTTVLLSVTSTDVIHSWWIPELGGKFDAVNGFNSWTWFKIPAEKAGRTFTGQCAELCGRNHANMTATVKALEPAEFGRWLEQQKRDLAQAEADAAEKRAQLQATGTIK